MTVHTDTAKTISDDEPADKHPLRTDGSGGFTLNDFDSAVGDLVDQVVREGLDREDAAQILEKYAQRLRAGGSP